MLQDISYINIFYTYIFQHETKIGKMIRDKNVKNNIYKIIIILKKKMDLSNWVKY